MIHPEPRILTFDVVGTLIDFEAGILAAIRGLLAEARRLDDDRILEAFGRAEDRQQRATPELPFTGMLAPIYRSMAAELDLPTTDAAVRALRESIPDWPAFPDAPPALRRLRERHRLVALTNADNWAVGQLAATLGQPFDDVVTAEDVGANKPDPRVFAYCLGRQSNLGYRLPDYLHVAQSQYHDIGVAHRLGFRTCWIERRAGRANFGATPSPPELTTPDHHFPSLTGLVELLNRT